MVPGPGYSTFRLPLQVNRLFREIHVSFLFVRQVKMQCGISEVPRVRFVRGVRTLLYILNASVTEYMHLFGKQQVPSGLWVSSDVGCHYCAIHKSGNRHPVRTDTFFENFSRISQQLDIKRF